MKNRLLQQVLKTIRTYGMVAPGERIVVAVSGGPDSVFLVWALAALRGKLRIGDITICHLDHGLRGAAARADAAFVKTLARQMGLHFVAKRSRIAPDRPGDRSVEEVARQVRYDFFGSVARRVGASVIATGHTLDDQAETVLMRIIKGASLKGIAGVPPVRAAGSQRIIRPLIEIEKSVIRLFLDASGIAYRIDESNAMPVYFRNVVRQEILPFLAHYNPRIKRALTALAEHVREDVAFIEHEKRERTSRLMRQRSGVITLKLKDVVIQPKALQKEILRDCLEAVGGDVKRLSFRHWKELESLLAVRAKKGIALDLPGSIRAHRTATDLIMRRISSCPR